MGIVGRIVNEDQGYAITLPDGWLRLDLESGLSQFFAAAALADPSVAEQCESSSPEELQACLEEQAAEVEQAFQELTDAGAQLAMDVGTVDKPFPTLVILLALPKTPGTTPELLLAVGPTSLRAIGVTGRIGKGSLEVPAGTAVYFEYTLPASEVANARTRDFYLIADDAVYEVLVIAHKSDDGLTADADALIESFEILP